jgi:Uma2 family endonuclease
MSVAARQFLTLAEYFAIEEGNDLKHEYVSGAMYALAGARASHNRMVSSMALAVGSAARAKGCDFFVADMKLQIGDTAVYYPDLMVCCDPADNDQLVRTSPCLIVEVLSPSTATVDRREKLHSYLAIPHLLSYLIVDPEMPMVESHIRVNAEAPWKHETQGLDGVLFLPCPVVTIDINQLYA